MLYIYNFDYNNLIKIKKISIIGPFAAGWYFGEKETSIPGVWQFKDVLTVLHSKFGIFPFFKVSVENK